jgi:hypothetical protein
MLLQQFAQAQLVMRQNQLGYGKMGFYTVIEYTTAQIGKQILQVISL